MLPPDASHQDDDISTKEAKMVPKDGCSIVIIHLCFVLVLYSFFWGISIP